MFALLSAVALTLLQMGLSEHDLNRLSEASGAAITAKDGPIQGEPLGRFETALGQAQAFRTDFTQRQFRRRYIFLIRPVDSTQGPISVMLTSNAEVDEMARSRGDRPPLFLDLYTCNTHSTIGVLMQEPSYDELRALIMQKLRENAPAISSTQAFVAGGCNYGAYILPGLKGRQ